MARTKDEIMSSMLTAKENDSTLARLSGSVVAIWRLIMYIITDALYNHELIFDEHKNEVNTIVTNKTPHRPSWYADRTLLFQFGHSLVSGTDYYDNSAFTEEQIEASRVVKYAAAVQSRDKSILFLKVATNSGGSRVPLPSNQLEALKAYFEEISDAGVYIEFINDPADDMKLSLDIYYDALMLDNTGSRLDGSAVTPVQDAIRTYLANLPFNGSYTNQGLIDVLQKVVGVEIAELKYAASRYGAYTEFTEINAREIAHAGYYKVTDTNLTLNFIANEELL